MAYISWGDLSQAQQREIKTACVLVSLGDLVRTNVASIANAIKSPVKEEIQKLECQSNLSPPGSEYLRFLREIYNVPASLDGIKKLETLATRASHPAIVKLFKKAWDRFPSIMQFSGFASLIECNAVSKFISFAINWRYTGKDYHAPRGMASPFPGYDSIIDALMGHPKCVAEMEKQIKAWQKASGKVA